MRPLSVRVMTSVGVLHQTRCGKLAITAVGAHERAHERRLTYMIMTCAPQPLRASRLTEASMHCEMTSNSSSGSCERARARESEQA